MCWNRNMTSNVFLELHSGCQTQEYIFVVTFSLYPPPAIASKQKMTVCLLAQWFILSAFQPVSLSHLHLSPTPFPLSFPSLHLPIPILPSLHSFSGKRGDEASSVLHGVLWQWRWRSWEPQRFSDLLLHQGPSLLQTPAGQQHQRSGRHLLRL